MCFEVFVSEDLILFLSGSMKQTQTRSVSGATRLGIDSFSFIHHYTGSVLDPRYQSLLTHVQTCRTKAAQHMIS